MPIHNIAQNNLGFDIQNVINQLVQVRSQPIQRLKQENSQIQEKVSAWGTFEEKVSKLRSSAESVTDFQTWDKMTSSSSDEGVLTASVNSNAAPGTYAVDVSHLAQSHQVSSKAFSDTTSDLGFDGNFTIGGETIDVNTGDSLKDIRDKINTAANNMADSEKVEATIVDTTLVLEREQTGSTDIKIGEGSDGANILDSSHLDIWDSTNKFHHVTQQAQDLDATVDGVSVARSSNTGIDDVIEGVTLDFRSSGSSTLEVATDVEEIKSTINDFISAYNTAMSTAEEKTSITTKDNGEVETGLLQGSTVARLFQNEARSIVGSKDSALPDGFQSLQEVGIGTTGKANRLSITDAEALEEAIRNHPEKTEQLFSDDDHGVVQELSDYLYSMTKAGGTLERRQQNLREEVTDNTEEIRERQSRLQEYQQQLWKRYGRLNTMVGRMKQQTSFLGNMGF